MSTPINNIEVAWIDETESEEDDCCNDEKTDDTDAVWPMERILESPPKEYPPEYSAYGICNPKMKQILEQQRLKASGYDDGGSIVTSTTTTASSLSLLFASQLAIAPTEDPPLKSRVLSLLSQAGEEEWPSTIATSEVVDQNNSISIAESKMPETASDDLNTSSNKPLASADKSGLTMETTGSDSDKEVSFLGLSNPDALCTNPLSLIDPEAVVGASFLFTSDSNADVVEVREILSLSPIPSRAQDDDELSMESYYEYEASLLTDPRTPAYTPTKATQAIEVVYDPNLFGNSFEEDEGKRRACWPARRKPKENLRHGFYR